MKKTIKKRIMLTKTSSVLHERFTHLKNLTLQTLNIENIVDTLPKYYADIYVEN